MTFEEIEHELRTPLASMRSLSEILRDFPDLTEDERRRFLDVIVDESERLGRAVDRLLGSAAACRRGASAGSPLAGSWQRRASPWPTRTGSIRRASPVRSSVSR